MTAATTMAARTLPKTPCPAAPAAWSSGSCDSSSIPAGGRDRRTGLRLEVHGVAQAVSPPGSGSLTSVATGATRRFFDLESDSFGGGDVAGATEIDRLNLRWDRPGFRMVAGRQAITWGVNYFWPVLDLFAPFAPQRIDRAYKPGVDALRFTVPVGDFSEVEVIAASQGTRTPDDLSFASLGRFPQRTRRGPLERRLRLHGRRLSPRLRPRGLLLGRCLRHPGCVEKSPGPVPAATRGAVIRCSVAETSGVRRSVSTGCSRRP